MTHPIDITLIDHVVIRVSDLDRMIAFYRDVLGCSLEKGPGDGTLAQLRAGASLIDLLGTNGVGPDEASRNLDHVCLQLERWDGAEIRAHLVRHGVQPGNIEFRYGARGDGPSMYLQDPEGNGIELKGPPGA